MAIGPIPYTALLQYCERNRMDEDQAEEFIWLVQRLDQKYLERNAANAKSPGVQQKDHAAGRSGRNKG